MKEIQPQKINIDPTHEERQEKLESKYIGSIKNPPKGHKIYKFCKGVLSELKESDYYDEEMTVQTSNNRMLRTAKRKIKHEPNTIYFTALNVKTAVKKLNKAGKHVNLIQ